MTRFIVLDSEPLGLLCNSKRFPVVRACAEWSRHQTKSGTILVVPEIADYEVRRELLRIGNRKSVLKLDSLHLALGVLYLPITTAAMRLAAELWAATRVAGLPTADPKALDGDVILAAQTRLLEDDYGDIVVATGNVGHLERFVDARRWQEIPIL